MRTLDINDTDKILIIAPHPDDESVGCGGLLAKYSSQCEVWVLTDGRYGGKQDEETVKHIRTNEFQNEMNALGIERFKKFDIYDLHLFEKEDLLINEDLSGFTKIFVSYRFDEHMDHQMAYKIIKRAMEGKNISAELYEYEVWTPLQRATHFLDISEVIDLKEKSISFHETQLLDTDYCRMMRGLAAYRAESIGIRGGYVEWYLSI